MRAFDDYDTPLESKTEAYFDTASKTDRQTIRIWKIT